jgi:hypothetical protein
MDYLLDILEKKYTNIELQKIATKLDKTFRLNYFWNGWKDLENVFFKDINIDWNYLKKNYNYRDIYNHIIMKYGKTESIIKYYLCKEFISNDDEVGLYEFNIGNSRLDFGRINGHSYAYEIKTELDTLTRLNDQIVDYESVFEYIYVVIHKKHLKKIKDMLPKKVGIISYDFFDEKVTFCTIRESKENKKYKKNIQLNTLTSSDLKFIIKNIIEIDVIPELKKDRLKIVQKNLLKSDLNLAFKQAIKHKQFDKWKHIKDNFDVLYPIEIQDAYTNKFDITLLYD